MMRHRSMQFSIPAQVLLTAALLTSCGGGDAPAGGSAAARSSSIPYAPTPDADAFYVQPASLSGKAPGTLLNSREISFAPGMIPQPNPAWQIQYVTRDVNGQAIAAIATVIMPLAPGPSGQQALVSFQHAYDSLGAPCTPSHTVTGDFANANSNAETALYLPGLQTQGWTMIIPDYEGPYHAYGAGPLSGQATLDGMRAALQFEPLGLAADTPVAMWGYSGGALATAWAATLQPRYAPELNLVGVASGGTPADVFEVVKNAEDSPFFGLILSAIFGTARAFPELLPPSLLNDKGRQTIESIKDGCVGDTTDGSSAPSGKLADYTTVADPYETPGARAVKPRVTLPLAGQSPTADIYVYHEMLDELIPIAGADAMVAAWCAAGTPVSYFRSVSGEHISGAVTGGPAAFAYLVGQFNGSPVPLVPPLATRCN